MTDHEISESRGDASRRAVMGGFVGLGLGSPLLAACGSDSDSEGGGETGPSGGGTTSGAVGKTSEVPVGGGKIFAGDKVVVTQPTEGEFKAFSAVCTHQGCVVANIKGKDINCTCHGSKFSTVDGSVVNGPADRPLAELKVTVEGEDLTVS